MGQFLFCRYICFILSLGIVGWEVGQELNTKTKTSDGSQVTQLNSVSDMSISKHKPIRYNSKHDYTRLLE